MTNNKAEPRNVTMYPPQWAAIDQLAAEDYYNNVSMALRRIVDEWRILTGRVGADAPTLLVDTRAEYTTKGE